MSLWYSCTFAAIGTDAEIQKLNAALDTYWHHAKVENRLSPGFVQVQASRNYGAHDAIEKMIAGFPGVVFIGSLYDDQNFGNDCIDNSGDVDSCQWWRFHGLVGLVEWHEMPDSPRSEVEALGSKTEVMSEEERKNFREIRRQAGLRIDPSTAEVTWWYVQDMDPYGIDPDLPDQYHCISRGYFARAPESDIWVCFHDLPTLSRDALWEKHKHNLGFPAGLPVSREKPLDLPGAVQLSQ
jgi:hypothetical protein